MRIAVVVPTWRRPADLERCLAAVAAQQRAADQLLVVLRDEDRLSAAVVRHMAARLPQLQRVPVQVPGVVAALNAGLDALRADVIAFTDDDAAPHRDWLQRIEAHFRADSRLGGLGGRDIVHENGAPLIGSLRDVGRLTWYGRCIGNHHLGTGATRPVDMLKGVNMSFRVAALGNVRFDTRLRGAGAQVANELGVSLAVRRRGWSLRYDPQLLVDHFPAIRHDIDQRGQHVSEAISNAAYNEALLLCEHFALPRRALFMAWALAIGHRASPGLAQWLRLRATRAPMAGLRTRAALAGRLAAWRAAGRRSGAGQVRSQASPASDNWRQPEPPSRRPAPL